MTELIWKLALLLLLPLSACATQPYIELGFGYQENDISDPFFNSLRNHPNGNQLGQPWTVQVEVGIEFGYERRRWYDLRPDRCGHQHESKAFDGGPFNNNPEIHRELTLCKRKWGGL